MTRTALYLVSAALCTALLTVSGATFAQTAAPAAQYPNYTYGYPPGYNYGFGYPNYYYNYDHPFAWMTAPLGAAAAAPAAVARAATAPLMTGRSVAVGPAEMGKYCTTPAKTCLLRNESWVGNGCSCRVPGGRARGSVTP
jgi:hypothetical protein